MRQAKNESLAQWVYRETKGCLDLLGIVMEALDYLAPLRRRGKALAGCRVMLDLTKPEDLGYDL